MNIYRHSVVIFWEKTVPHFRLEVKLGVMEYEPAIWVVFSDYLSGLRVPFFQNFGDWLILWLVNWLKCINLFTPFFKEGFMDLESPLLRLVVDIIVLHGCKVPITEPS